MVGTAAGRLAAGEGRALLGELLPSVRGYAIPMRTRFRGITVREGALIRGPAGWGEFSPFAEYGPRECARWLACALEAACDGWPVPARDSVPGQPLRGKAASRSAASRQLTVRIRSSETNTHPGNPLTAVGGK